jgi:hypothetical protein
MRSAPICGMSCKINHCILQVHYIEGESEEESDEDGMLDGEEYEEDWDSDDDIMEPLEADGYDDVDESDEEDDIE